MGSVNLCCIEPRRAERSIRVGVRGINQQSGLKSARLACCSAALCSELSVLHPSQPADVTPARRQQVLSLSAEHVLCRFISTKSSPAQWPLPHPASTASPIQSGGVSPRGFAQQSEPKVQLEAAAAGCWEGTGVPPLRGCSCLMCKPEC